MDCVGFFQSCHETGDSVRMVGMMGGVSCDRDSWGPSEGGQGADMRVGCVGMHLVRRQQAAGAG